MAQRYQRRQFHDYFVTHLPSSSIHPDSRSAGGPHHKFPRAAATPHAPGLGPSPAAASLAVGPSRELTVVRIPLRSAKHHFGVAISRGTRPYNEDRHQAGTIEIPAFAKRAPMSLSRKPASPGKHNTEGGVSAQGASGDPQVFYFGVFDGHGGQECSEFLKDELHSYIEKAAHAFGLASSLSEATKANKGQVSRRLNIGCKSLSGSDPSLQGQKPAFEISSGSTKEGDDSQQSSQGNATGKLRQSKYEPAVDGVSPDTICDNKAKAEDLEAALVEQWKDMVGGYFRRFKPDHFVSTASKRAKVSGSSPPVERSSTNGVSIETVLMYAFLNADLDFITAQASKPDATSDAPLNNNEVLGHPSQMSPACRVGGPNRFHGGSTASIAMISTPTTTPFWHPASPSTIVAAHVGDTRILLCETLTGLPVPITTDHHPSSPIEGSRLRRYAATFVTDSFGEERMSGLANTRAFGDMRSKRIGVSAEPELVRLELGPAQYSMLVLVSDGVSGTLSDQEIVDVVKEARTPEQGAKDVVTFATEVTREGDNCTCLVVRLGGWERRGEGGMGSLGTKEAREWRKNEAGDPRSRRT
ncbi:MAG: hypothetical protein M1818_006600 [Claussenomyces sp. TS43310]|nr:MAG: hypothetical protein M1818_006965 [Claussenomyces sp. TS43310]KAI9735023.1 MAG: hypothetical protein M1818_006600 [Claussenomyces sp. TS43310]